MIGTVGQAYLLGLQAAGLATATWRLLTGTVPLDSGTTWALLMEAAWSGYLPQTAGPWTAPYQQGGYARIDPQTLPGFGNNSGVNQNPTGWALLASDGVTLIAWDVFPVIVVVAPAVTTYFSFGLIDQGR